MKSYSLRQTWLVWLLLLATSCNGQTQTRAIKATATATHGPAKIVKPQGSHEFDAISCMLQDKTGNIWFASSWGVYRYDGKIFTLFTTKDGLTSNYPNCMLEDEDGNIWFGTRNGLCIYNPSINYKNGSKCFTAVPIVEFNSNAYLSYNSPDNSSVPKDVRSMMQDKSGKIWLGTGDGVYCYKRRKSASGNVRMFTLFLDGSVVNEDSVQLKWIDCILEDKKGNIWFASGGKGQEGVCRYNGKSIVSLKPYGDRWIYSILEGKNGSLFFVTRSHGVCRYNPTATGAQAFTNITASAGIDNESVNSIAQDKVGNLWFGVCSGNSRETYDGALWRYNSMDSIPFTKFTTKDGLPHNGVWSVKADSDDNIWVGTTDAGLCRYNSFTAQQRGAAIFTNFTK